MTTYQDQYIFKAEAQVTEALSQIEQWLSMLDQARARAGQGFPTQQVLTNPPGLSGYPTNEQVRSTATAQAQVNQVFEDGIETQRRWLDVVQGQTTGGKAYTKVIGDTTQYLNRLGQVTREVNTAQIDLGDGFQRTQVQATNFAENMRGNVFRTLANVETDLATGLRSRTFETYQERFAPSGQPAAPELQKRVTLFTQAPNALQAAFGAQEREVGRVVEQYQRLENGQIAVEKTMQGMARSTDSLSNRMVRHMQIIVEAIVAYEAFRLVGQVASEWVTAHREMDWALAQFKVNVEGSSLAIEKYLQDVGKLAYATGTARPEVFETAALATRLERPELAKPATEIEMMWGMQSTEAVRDLYAIQQQFPQRSLDDIMNTLIRATRAGSLAGDEVLAVSETWGAFSKQFSMDLEGISALFIALGTILGETGNSLETFMRHLEKFYTDDKLAALTEQITGTPTTTISKLTGEEIRRPMVDILRDIATMSTPAQLLEVGEFMPQELGQKSRQFFNTLVAQFETVDSIMMKATGSNYTWGEAIATVSDTAEIAARRMKTAWQNALAAFGETDAIKKVMNDIAAGLEAVAQRNTIRNQFNWVSGPTEGPENRPGWNLSEMGKGDEALNRVLKERFGLEGLERILQANRISASTGGGTVLGPSGMSVEQWVEYRNKLSEEFYTQPEFDWRKSGEELALAFAAFTIEQGPAIAEAIMGRPEQAIQQGYGQWARTETREAGVVPRPTPQYTPEMIPGTPQWQWVNPAARGFPAQPEIAFPIQTILDQIALSQEAARRTGGVFQTAQAQGVELPEKMVTAYEELVRQLQGARDAVSAVDPEKPAAANRLLAEAAEKAKEVMDLAGQISEMQRDFLAEGAVQPLDVAGGFTSMGIGMSTLEEGGQALDMAEVQTRLDTAVTSMEQVVTLMGEAAMKFDYAADAKTTIPQEVIDFYGSEQDAIAAIIEKYDELNAEIQASAEAHGVARTAQEQAVIFLDEFGRVIGADSAEANVLAIALGFVSDAANQAAAGLLSLGNVSIPTGISFFDWSTIYTEVQKDVEDAAKRAGISTDIKPQQSLFMRTEGEIEGVGYADPNLARITNQRASEVIRLDKEAMSQRDRLASQAQSEADRRHREAIGVMQGIIAAIPGVTGPTPVTGADLYWRSATGQYEDKFDEPVRRARAEVNNIIAGRPHEYELPADLFTPELMGFAQAQPTEQKEAILKDTLAEYERQFYGGMRPGEYDKDTFIANAMKVVQEKQQAKETQAMYMQWLQEAGLGPESEAILGLMDEAPLVKALTGGKAPEEVKQQLAEYVALDSEQIQTDGVTDAFTDTFKDFNWVAIIDTSVRASIDADKDTLIATGKLMGMVLADGASDGFVAHIVNMIWMRLAASMTAP